MVQKYHSLDIDMNELEMDDITDFALTLKEGRKRKTINGYLAGIKSFLKRSYKHHDYTTLKFDQIEFMKQESYTADILTDTELQELFSMPEIHEQQEILAIRNELIIKMLYCTGMRVSEIANLTVDQVEEQQFSIIGK